MFISELTKNVYEAADANCVEYCHLADYVQQSDELDFLHGELYFHLFSSL